jgi:phosphohistidine phosphatase
MRHASAGQAQANPVQDNKRPLDKKGIEQCRHVGRLLRALEVQVDAIISSPLPRATETAALVGKQIGYRSQLLLDPALGPGASYQGFRRLLRRHAKQEAIMVVGHNPSLSEFLSLLVTNGAFDRVVDMSKGSVARLEYEGQQPPPQPRQRRRLLATPAAVLGWLVTPKIARAAQSDSKAASSRPKTSRK